MLSRRVARLARAVAAWAPSVGLAPRPPARPDGISAMVRVRGDEEWIEPCLRSVQALADEIVVLDNGASAETRAAIERARAAPGAAFRVLDCAGDDLLTLSNRGLDACRLRWIVRWDADFVAHTDGAHSIRQLRDFLLGLPRRRYFLVEIRAGELAGDLAHQFPDLRCRDDGQAVVWSPAIRYVTVRRTVPVERLATPDRVLRTGGRVRRALETLSTPRYYRVLRWPDAAYVHVNVKSGRQMLLRHFWLEWLDACARGEAVPWEEYVTGRVEREWGLRDLAAAERAYVAAYCQALVPYDARGCGPYPALLRPYLEAPRYRVEYRDGVIVGRKSSEGGSAHPEGGCAPPSEPPPWDCAGEAGARSVDQTGGLMATLSGERAYPRLEGRSAPVPNLPPEDPPCGGGARSMNRMGAPSGTKDGRTYPCVAERLVAGAALLPCCERLLDVGCGDGALALVVGGKARRHLGVDGGLPVLAKAAAQGVSVQCAGLDAPHLPYRDGAFAAAACLDVLEHVLDPRHLLGELARVLEPGGVLVLTTPNIRYYGFLLTLLRGRFPRTSGDPEGYDGGHLHYFTFTDVRLLLRETGRFAAIEELGLYRFTSLTRWGRLKERVKALLGDHVKREFFSGAVVVRARRTA